MELKQELKLKQTLSQKMIQSASILQMGQMELREYIEEMALENPVVDLEEREPENGRLEENGELIERIRRLEELSSLDSQNQTYYQDEEEEAGRFEPGRSQDGLLESLLEQACMLHLPEKEEKIFRYMIKNLDASGYLSVDFGELCEGLGIKEAEGERIWKHFRSLEPLGIGARSLKECLLMQLSYLPEKVGAGGDIAWNERLGLGRIAEKEEVKSAEKAEKKRTQRSGEIEKIRNNGKLQTEILAAHIISSHLDLLGKNQMKQLARVCSCKLEDVLLAAARIRELNPKPGSGYGNEDYDKYIVPDIIITQTEHGFELQLSDETLPQVVINPYYLSLMKQKDTETEAKDYIEGKIRQAEWVCQCIGQRNQTLTRLAEEILCVQEEFFLKGSGKLVPWTQKKAAEALGVSESTISRTVREKYLQCRWGIFPLSYFFSRHTAAAGFGMTDKGRMVNRKETTNPEELAKRAESANREETANQAEVANREEMADQTGVTNRMELGGDPREAIRRLIKTENPKKPFSDRMLAEKLAEEGITLSRRTVAKYREEMGIRDASGRKHF